MSSRCSAATAVQPTAPLHACPGHAAGMGLLLGTVCALLQAGGDLRPSPVPLSLTFVGTTP